MSSLLPLCWKVIQLGTLVDNLTVDPDTGDILAGCHPNAIKLLMYNTEDPPGSEVSSYTSLSSWEKRQEQSICWGDLGEFSRSYVMFQNWTNSTYGKSKDLGQDREIQPINPFTSPGDSLTSVLNSISHPCKGCTCYWESWEKMSLIIHIDPDSHIIVPIRM